MGRRPTASPPPAGSCTSTIFPKKTWKRPDVVSKSNCPACHRGAEQGDYDDD
ncbi:MAG: diheme cytochrome c [Magnetospirillum sp.]|nr:diheme cytochrome c [Magnetospirillum sp.]